MAENSSASPCRSHLSKTGIQTVAAYLSIGCFLVFNLNQELGGSREAAKEKLTGMMDLIGYPEQVLNSTWLNHRSDHLTQPKVGQYG
jgi:hypothetical protein